MRRNKSRTGVILKKQIKFVCDTEIKSLKPGNVHKYSEGHGMGIKDFLKSSLIISECLTKNNLDLGKKILVSVSEIQNKIKKNTNLGIILMLSPIATIVQKEGVISKEELLKKIKSLIKKQNIKNSIPIFKAISLTSPGGLGFSKKYDVNEPSNTNLYKAMEFAKEKDLIARQYCNGFEDIYKIGIPAYKIFYNKWGKVDWALTGVYLTFLKKFNDSHIVRNKGNKIATSIKKEAKKYYFFLKNNKSLTKIKKKLLVFDKKLKSNGINPGTTADLTVATLLLEIVTKKQ